MRLFIKFVMLSGIVFALTACGSDSTSTTENRRAVAKWLIDYDTAIEKSRESDRPILMNFTGSDWCPPCVQMKKDVFSTEQFAEYAEKNLVLLELDFPHHQLLKPEIRQHNEALAERFGIQIFPTYLLVDAEGNELNRITGYVEGGIEGFVTWIEG